MEQYGLSSHNVLLVSYCESKVFSCTPSYSPSLSISLSLALCKVERGRLYRAWQQCSVECRLEMRNKEIQHPWKHWDSLDNGACLSLGLWMCNCWADSCSAILWFLFCSMSTFREKGGLRDFPFYFILFTKIWMWSLFFLIDAVFVCQFLVWVCSWFSLSCCIFCLFMPGDVCIP